jgi:N-acetylmuramoyl-L-alanine amidase
MLPITEMFIPVNQFSRKGTKIAKVKGIVMHYTADPGASAVAIAKYFANLRKQDPNDKNARFASATFEVDDVSIVAALPYKPGAVEMAYHVGSKTYTPEALKKFGSYPNNCTVGIEMCLDKNGNITEKTFQNSADLVAFLCKLYGLTEADITTHKAVVGWKDCPLPWVKKPSELDRFKAEVHNRLHPAPAAPPKPTYLGTIEVLVDTLNVRSDDSLSATVVKTIKKGEKYKAYKLSNGMYNIGGDQWCSANASYVKFTKA